MPIQTAQQRENLAVAYGAAATFASAHSASPGATGANELAVTRKAVTWAPGTVDGTITATVTLDIPTGVTVGGIGLWTAVTGGTYLDGGTVTSQAYSSAGTYTVTFTFTQS